MNEEKQLVKQCRNRSARGFDRLYQRYASVLFGICLRYGGNKEAAEDILQDVFVTIFKKIDSYRFEGSFEGWLKRITVNVAINYLRKQKRKYLVSVDDNEYVKLESYDADAISKLSEMEILESIQRLPEGYRTVFNLYVIEGYKHKDIAEMLGITESTSRTQLAKARKALQLDILRKYE